MPQKPEQLFRQARRPLRLVHQRPNRISDSGNVLVGVDGGVTRACKPGLKVRRRGALTCPVAQRLQVTILGRRDRPNSGAEPIHVVSEVGLRQCPPAIGYNLPEIAIRRSITDRQRTFDLQAQPRRAAGGILKINDDIVERLAEITLLD